MKIKVRELSYEKALARAGRPHKRPRRPSGLLRFVIRRVSAKELKQVHFSWVSEGMETLGRREPCLILMNHSSFIDLKIAHRIFARRPFQIVCTSDGFVGKERLMRSLGCIPTQKFVTDLSLVRDMIYCLRNLRTSVLLFPEASYSFDGTATPLPESLAKLIRMLGVPVVFVETFGAFARDPLYNGLQVRKVDVSARVRYLLTPAQTRDLPVEEIDARLRQAFSFNYFHWQQQNRVRVKEPFRADHLNRVLYKCPHCRTEGRMTGRGTQVVCGACGKRWELTETGWLQAVEGITEYPGVPEWYAWERTCVRKELEAGTYRLDTAVDILVLTDMKAVYHVGAGRLIHDADGFHLTGCGGRLDVHQPPEASYSLYADYYWYERGDMICIAERGVLYYCFPQEGGDVVAKTRLAAEELYKLRRAQRENGTDRKR